MKLLFDQNLSFRLVAQLSFYFPDSTHVRLLGFEQMEDFFIWQYARNHNFAIVTQDADFDWLSQLHGFPPKIIWLRCGNTSTSDIRRLLIENHSLLLSFETDEILACLELG